MLRLDELDLFVIATQGKWYGPGAALEGVLGTEHSYVLTGSVRDHAGGVRITVRIIEAETGTQIWSAAYDEPPSIEHEPELQASVARDAAAAAAPFGPVFDAELALARRAAHTLELPDCQTRYRAFRRATDPALFPEAFACFQSLVERRPELAHAWAGLAMMFVDEHMFHEGDGESLNRAHAAVQGAQVGQPPTSWPTRPLTRVQYYSGDPAFVSTAEKRSRSIRATRKCWACSASCSRPTAMPFMASSSSRKRTSCRRNRARCSTSGYVFAHLAGRRRLCGAAAGAAARCAEVVHRAHGHGGGGRAVRRSRGAPPKRAAACSRYRRSSRRSFRR